LRVDFDFPGFTVIIELLITVTCCGFDFRRDVHMLHIQKFEKYEQYIFHHKGTKYGDVEYTLHVYPI